MAVSRGRSPRNSSGALPMEAAFLPIIFIEVDSAMVSPSIFLISSASFPMLLNMGLLAMAEAEPAKEANFR